LNIAGLHVESQMKDTMSCHDASIITYIKNIH
jgi:hypothetical protein